MMTVVGEEGTPIDDFTVMLKSEFFDNVYLQQNAFDEVDGATPAERQQFVFDKVLTVLRMDFDFDTKEQARDVMFQAQDLFRNWNYAAPDSDEYKSLLSQIDAFLENKGRTAEAGDQAPATAAAE
jgi:V/A-type H+-transporting ATPase subunit A